MSNRNAFSLLAFVAIGYIAVLTLYSPLPLQDYANHIVRAAVMSDLLFQDGQRFGGLFEYHFLFTSYVVPDLLFTVLVNVMGVQAASAVGAVLVFLALPAALLFYLRSRETAPEIIVPMLLVSFYLSTDSFFVMGFMAFKLSIAVVLVAMALVERLRRGWSGRYFVAFLCVIVLAYLVHLACIAFIAAAVGVSSIWRVRQDPARTGVEASLLIPIGCMLGWHFLQASGLRRADDLLAQGREWSSVAGKLARLHWNFARYNRWADEWILSVFLAFVATCVALRWNRFRSSAGRAANPANPMSSCAQLGYIASRPDSLQMPAARSSRTAPARMTDSQSIEALMYAAVFFALYAVLPLEEVEASYIDVRAMALAPLFLTLAALSLPAAVPVPHGRVAAIPVVLGVLLTTLNIGELAIQFRRESQWLDQYRAVISKLPQGATVLPVYTRGRTGNVYLRLHQASYVVTDRAALTPYLFSGDRGNPMKYFRYRDRPYAPDELWYYQHKDSSVDWGKVTASYGYLLVMKPFDPSRIRVPNRTVAENDAAALLRVGSAGSASLF